VPDANATVMQAAAGWGAPRDFPRAILRLIGTGLIAWGEAITWLLVGGAVWIGVRLVRNGGSP
jgi:hypothetical protein